MHNLDMKWVLALSFTFVIQAFAGSDFDIEKRRLERRYEAFYQRIQEKQRKSFFRQDLVKVHKKRREKRTRDYNMLRRRFVQKRKKGGRKRDGLEAKYQASLERKATARNKVRLKYIKQKKRLEKVRESSMMIPPAQDVGLEEI